MHFSVNIYDRKVTLKQVEVDRSALISIYERDHGNIYESL